MKRLRPIAALLLAALGLSCSENSGIYYTDTYPIVRLDAEVRIDNGSADGDTDEGPDTEDPLAAAIREEVLATAPVRVGGRYRLDYVEHDRGILYVRTGEGEEELRGAFGKQPGAVQFALFFRTDAAEYDYVCSQSTYLTDQGTERTLLSIDLTAHYRELYPDEAIIRVRRLEYTDHPIR